MPKIDTPQTKTIFSEKGQSTIEFLMTFSFALGFTFLFIYQAINMTTGYMAHYATFMASRVFLTYEQAEKDPGPNFSSAANIAKEVFRKYNLDRFDLGNGKLVVNKPRPVQDHSQLFTGVHYSYQMKLTAFELVGGKDKATFHSESFLGKEPVRASCWQNICAAMGQASCNDSMDITVYDNGC